MHESKDIHPTAQQVLAFKPRGLNEGKFLHLLKRKFQVWLSLALPHFRPRGLKASSLEASSC